MFLAPGSTQHSSGFSLPHNTYPYILLHREITKNDGNVYEPILEREMIIIDGQMEIFSKTRFYSHPDPLASGFSIILYFATF